MLLYHGTSGEAWDAIKAAGAILPRGQTKRDNWKHTIGSHPKAVYLTSTYASYYAMSAVDIPEDSEASMIVAIIEIDSDKLDALVPDEDYLEQSSRPKMAISKREMIQRTRAAKGQLKSFVGDDAWQASLDWMGTCANLAPVPLEAITRVALVDVRDNRLWGWDSIQPMITRANFVFCGDDYRKLQAQAFDIAKIVIDKPALVC